MNANVDLSVIEEQEASALRESQALRRAEATKRAMEAEAKAKAEAAENPALLPRAQGADLAVSAIMNGEKVSLDFEGENGEGRHVDVYTKGPRMTKEDTIAMRTLLNSLGRCGLEVATAEGMNGLIAHYKPGKSTCLVDRSFMQLIRSLESMESGTDTMTVKSYKILLPLFKLLRRRAG